MPTWSRWPWLVSERDACGLWLHRSPSHRQTKPDRDCTHHAEGFRRASPETQPRCGVTLGGVKRLGKDTRASREAGTRRRQGRWDPTHGEQQDQPSYFTGSGSCDAPRLKNIMKTSKKLLPTLDIGSHSNARFQARRRAGARHERTLFAVACKPLLGMGYPPASRCSPATAALCLTHRLTCTRQHVCLCTVRWPRRVLCCTTNHRSIVLLCATGSV